MLEKHNLLGGVLANSREREFIYDAGEIQKFFFANREKYKILEGLSFDTDEIFPWNNTIDESMHDLVLSGILEISDIKRRIYLDDASKIFYKKFVKPTMNSFEISELEELSEEFSKKFCAPKTK